jgi:hypothetical protein
MTRAAVLVVERFEIEHLFRPGRRTFRNGARNAAASGKSKDQGNRTENQQTRAH